MSEEQGGGRVEVEQGRVAALVGWRWARSVFGVEGLCLQRDGRSRRGAGRMGVCNCGRAVDAGII